MRSRIAAITTSALSIIGFVPGAFGDEPRVFFDKPIDYSRLPGVYARSSDKQDPKCPAKFTLRADGSYKRVSSSGAVERGTSTKLSRKDERSGQPFQAKSSGGRKYKFNVLPSNNGVPGALIGFEVKDGNGVICGYVKDDPASRAMLPVIPADQAGRVVFEKKLDYDQIFGAFVETASSSGKPAHKACGHTLELGRKGAYERFAGDGKRERGTYTLARRTDDKSGQLLHFTSSKGKKYRASVMPTNEGNARLLMILEHAKNQTTICGFGRVARF